MKKDREPVSPVVTHTNSRWTFDCEELPEKFVVKVSFDHVKKNICVEYLDIITPNQGSLHALKLANKQCTACPATFKTYNAEGEWLYKIKFYSNDGHLGIVNHDATFDTANNNASTRKIVLSFDWQSIEYNKAVVPEDVK